MNKIPSKVTEFMEKIKQILKELHISENILEIAT